MGVGDWNLGFWVLARGAYLIPGEEEPEDCLGLESRLMLLFCFWE